jgi:hypothetical protein
MKITPIYPAALAILLLIGVFVSYVFFIMFAGFPDNGMSEQEAANIQLLSVFNWLSVALASWFLALAFLGRKRDIDRLFMSGCAVYAAAIVVALGIEAYILTNLMDSRGG